MIPLAKCCIGCCQSSTAIRCCASPSSSSSSRERHRGQRSQIRILPCLSAAHTLIFIQVHRHQARQPRRIPRRTHICGWPAAMRFRTNIESVPTLLKVFRASESFPKFLAYSLLQIALTTSFRLLPLTTCPFAAHLDMPPRKMQSLSIASAPIASLTSPQVKCASFVTAVQMACKYGRELIRYFSLMRKRRCLDRLLISASLFSSIFCATSVA